MASRMNTLLVNPASVATSNSYESGRTPELDEFSISSETGCSSTAIREPTAGSRTFGALISTPGIGPATAGLSGFELFEASHAATASIAVHTPRTEQALRTIEITTLVFRPRNGRSLGSARIRPGSVRRTQERACSRTAPSPPVGPAGRSVDYGQRMSLTSLRSS